MIPSFTGLQTALSGLEAAQAAIDTTGENISNANTPGYTRQVVNTVDNSSMVIPSVSQQGADTQLGTGVSISSVSRIRDQFLDIQYRAQNTATSNANSNSSELQQVQTAVNEPSSDGISNQLQQFWSAWSSLASSPTSPSAQQGVIEAGTTLAQTFNAVSAQMSTVQTQASQQYATLTGANGQVEQDASQIATLNGEIANATQAGQTPNDLLDQRDNLLDDLSGLAQVSVTTAANGSDTVSFGDAATPLVNGTTVTWPQTLTSASGGQLGSLLSLSSATGPIGTLSSSLDSVAGQVISAVNALQPSSPFFSGTSASTIAVSATASSIQTSSSATSGANLAQSIADLQGGSADQAYAAFVGQVGNSVSAAESTQSTAQSVLTAIGNQRQSVSGVSLDEEMTNLITYQQAYEASARMMNTMDSVLNTLINNTGVGT
ncbi:MAG: flagellar hook-associated protein FlgK [Solirubrobacteraceae bacterium]|jgi:flagellar hook-associated protein 1 FlgK